MSAAMKKSVLAPVPASPPHGRTPALPKALADRDAHALRVRQAQELADAANGRIAELQRQREDAFVEGAETRDVSRQIADAKVDLEEAQAAVAALRKIEPKLQDAVDRARRETLDRVHEAVSHAALAISTEYARLTEAFVAVIQKARALQAAVPADMRPFDLLWHTKMSEGFGSSHFVHVPDAEPAEVSAEVRDVLDALRMIADADTMPKAPIAAPVAAPAVASRNSTADKPIQRPDGSWSFPGNADYAALKGAGFQGKARAPQSFAEFQDERRRIVGMIG